MRALLFANGLYTPQDFAWLPSLTPNALWIAVDGGARALFHLQRIPHVFIGDQDSLPQDLQQRLRQHQVRILTYPEDKDQTDLEIALHFAYQQGAREFHLFGALGGRWDQTLANLLLPLQEPFRTCTFCFYVEGQRLCLVQSAYTLQGNPGDVVSILPFCREAQGVTLQGLHWTLQEATLSPGTTHGVSNRLVAPQAHIQVRQGPLWVIHLPQERHQALETAKWQVHRGGEP